MLVTLLGMVIDVREEQLNKESPRSNAYYAVADGNRGEGGAIFESLISNPLYAVANGNGGEGGAIHESPFSNACYAVGSAVVGDG